MFEVGTRVQWPDAHASGEVVDLDSHGIYVVWHDSPTQTRVHYDYSYLFSYGGNSARIVVIPDDTAEPIVQSDRGDARAIRYAGMIGAMGARLEDVYGSVLRAIKANDNDQTVSVGWNLDWVKGRIEDTAVTLNGMEMSDGIKPGTHLLNYINNHR